MAKGEFEKALNRFEAADGSSNGRSTTALALAAAVSGELSRWREMEVYGERLVALADDPVERALGEQAMGIARWRLYPKKPERALPHLKAATAAAPELAGPSFLVLAEAAEFQDDLELAAEHLGKALRWGVQGRWATPLTMRLIRAMKADEFRDRCRVGAADGRSETFDLGEWPKSEAQQNVVAPKRLVSPQPIWPEKLRRFRGPHVVGIQALILQSGRVACPFVTDSAGEGFDLAALESVSSWFFDPAKLNGKPVSVLYNIQVRFAQR